MNLMTGSSFTFIRASIWNSSEFGSVVDGGKGGLSSLDGGVTLEMIVLKVESSDGSLSLIGRMVGPGFWEAAPEEKNILSSNIILIFFVM